MTISVYDEDVTSSDIVGSAVVKLSAMCINQGIDEWYQMQHLGKSCGTVHIRSHWTPFAMGVKVAGIATAPAYGISGTATAQHTPTVNVTVSAAQPMGYGMQPQMGYGAQPMGFQQPMQPMVQPMGYGQPKMPSYGPSPTSYGVAMP
jgi:hypothetical protein